MRCHPNMRLVCFPKPQKPLLPLPFQAVTPSSLPPLHMHMHSRTHAHMHAHTHTHAYSCVHTHAHSCTHALTHTLAHTHSFLFKICSAASTRSLVASRVTRLNLWLLPFHSFLPSTHQPTASSRQPIALAPLLPCSTWLDLHLPFQAEGPMLCWSGAGDPGGGGLLRSRVFGVR